jgi:LIVCS family branched-chain amino acid:cation transporter
MELSKNRSNWFFNGLAMFSMFFGAGNIIFPLIIGLNAEGSVIWAFLGLFFTAVLIPFTGLFAMSLFKGDYKYFFSKMGNLPGKLLIWIILALIGPFGGIPRCIGLTYSTFKVSFQNLDLMLFGFLFCASVFLFSIKKRKVMDLLGCVLTPVLLFFLAVIVLKGLLFSGKAVAGPGLKVVEAFSYGLKEGYNTMDLLAAFFFSSVVFSKFKHEKSNIYSVQNNYLEFLKSTVLGAFLLALIYWGFAMTSALFKNELILTKPDEVLGSLGKIILGDYGGLVVSAVICLSCFTTAIALTAVASDFLKEELFKNKISYQNSMVVVLGISLIVSSLKFSAIVAILAPVLEVFYPSLLMLSVSVVANKLYGFKYVKISVYAVLISTMVHQLICLFASN